MHASRLPACIGITGLDTFVGLRTAERLLEAGVRRVVGLDQRLPRRLGGRIRFHRVDLTDPTADSLLAELLQKERCEAVLHCAFFSRPHPDRSYAHELELIGSLHAMNAVGAAGVRKLVVLSTAQVYGAYPDNPNYLKEDQPLRAHPDAPALQDRAELEQLLTLFAARHPGTVVTSLRPCWVMGPTVEGEAVSHFEGRRVTTALGFDPLLQILHEDDLLRAVERALEVDAPGAFNLAGRGVLPLSRLVRLAGKRARPIPHPLLYRLEYLRGVWRSGTAPAGFYDFLRFLWVVDTTRAEAELGFEAEYTTREAWMSFVISGRLRRYR